MQEDQRGHRRFEDVIAPGRQAADADGAAGWIRLDLGRVAQVGHAHQRGDAGGHDAHRPVRGVDPCKDQIGADVLQGRGEDAHRRRCVRSGQLAVRDQDAAGRAHRQGLAHRVGRVRRRHRDDRHLTAVRLHELERRLERVLVVAVHHGRRCGAVEASVGAEAFGARCRIGDGLRQDGDVQGADLRGARRRSIAINSPPGGRAR